MNNPLVSIIMPAFNAGSYIEETINSVIAQTYESWELMIVDDGSTDNTADVIKQCLDSEPRIKYFYQPNGKQGKARNRGIAYSNGDYIAFLDADDTWTNNKLAIQVNELSTLNDVDLLFSPGYFLNNDKITDYDVPVKTCWDKNDLLLFINYNQIPILSVLMKKDALLSVGCFSEEPEIQNMEDYHLWLKLLICGYKFRSLPSRLFYYRLHPEQSTAINDAIDKQSFYAYRDLYYRYPQLSVQKAIINKIRWFLFKDGFYPTALEMTIQYFNNAGKTIASFLIENIFSNNNNFSKRIVFRLIESLT